MIDHYEADVQTAQDYYPFGMIMPGRMFTALTVPGGSVTGTTQVNGFTVPVDLALTSRSGNEPTQYVASRTIDLDEGFESGTNDDVTAYLTDTSYAGSGNGGSGADGVAGAGKYRYGFNGKENDNEVKGMGDQIDYGMRVYDPRAGRFLSVDPLYKKYPELTSYQFGSNTPIQAIDVDGMEGSSLSDLKSQQKRELEYRIIKLNNNQVQLPPPHPQPTITSTTPAEIQAARENTARIDIMRRMYNSDASFSIQIFNGVGAATNLAYPEVSTTLTVVENFSDGNYQQGLEALTNLNLMKVLRFKTSEPKIETTQTNSSTTTSPKEGYTTFNDGYSREITHINGTPIKNLSYANQTINTKAGPVSFDEYGFPDFTPYSIKNIKVLNLTGQYSIDETMALRASNMKATPKEYVWHHHQDGETMMLVPKTVNNPAKGGASHTGGSAIIRHNNQNPNNQLQFPSPSN